MTNYLGAEFVPDIGIPAATAIPLGILSMAGVGKSYL